MTQRGDMTEMIPVRVDKATKNKLQKLADADHRKLSDFIRVQLFKLIEESERKKK